MQAKYRGGLIVAMVFGVVLFSLFTVFMQVQSLGLSYLKTWQLERHHAVLNGTAYGHWQYRLLSAYLVQVVMMVFQACNIPAYPVSAFIAVRVLQNIAIFSMTAVYYRRLGLSRLHVWLGLSLLAWGMTHVFYNSDLQFSTYSDVICYLAAGLLILSKRYLWIVPLTIMAALNRETSGLIPVMAGMYGYLRTPTSQCEREQDGENFGVEYFRQIGKTLRSRWQQFLKNEPHLFWVMTFSVCGYLIIQWGIRVMLGPRTPFYPEGVHFGVDLLVFNLLHLSTWIQLFATVGFIPLLSMYAAHRWPTSLWAFGVTIVPCWFLIHPFFSVMAETRNFLIPQILVFIPGALFGVCTPPRINANASPAS